MSNIADKISNTLRSGEQGTTGREVFEDSIATQGGQAYSSNNTSGDGQGVMSSSTLPGQTNTGSTHHHGTHGNASGLGSSVTGGQSEGLTGSHGTHGSHGSHGLGSGATGAGAGRLTGNEGLTGSHGSHSHGSHGIGSGTTGAGAAAGLTGQQHHSHGGQGLAANEIERGNHVPGQNRGGQSDLDIGQSGGSRVDQATSDRLPSGHQDKHRGVETAGAALAGAPFAATGAGRETSGQHSNLAGPDRTGDGSGVTATSTRGPDNNDYTSNSGSNTDRVGNRNQEGHLYERTGAGGPATSGAAGTDRFDTDRNAGVTGGGTREPGEATQRGEGKGTGGIGGILGTTDKEFTGRDRLGGSQSAYQDTHGHFKDNTSGPGGNTALTGREGDLSKNPVAQSQSRNDGSATSNATGDRVGVAHDTDSTKGAEHKEGLIDKIKHAVGK